MLMIYLHSIRLSDIVLPLDGLFYGAHTLTMQIGMIYHNDCTDIRRKCRYGCTNAPEKNNMKNKKRLDIFFFILHE